ncbi:MAG: site-2 protease family protein [Patescibacteria group bacterium]|nr:site-2 protease family protein [Patescibacteria group bacterium]
MQVDALFGLVVLIFSVVLHEVAHGYMANWLGDPTARLQGRLTLNPLVHVDPLGSVLLPAILLFTHSPILIGYAKPVPYNPYNLPGRYDEAFVAAAGPMTNIGLAVIFGLVIRMAPALDPTLQAAFGGIVLINILLACFNLIPVPPLDGSKVLSAFFEVLSPTLARGYNTFRLNFERLGVLSGTLLIMVIFYIVAPYFFGSILAPLFSFLTGVPL